jgi:hypothetical protein
VRGAGDPGRPGAPQRARVLGRGVARRVAARRLARRRARALPVATQPDDQLRAIGESGGLVGINFHVGFLRADGADDPDTPVSSIAEHAAHVADVAGVDAVALGSDFDGATMPAELGDVAGLPRVLDALRAAGFGDADVVRIAWGNWVRALSEALPGRGRGSGV